MLREEFQIQQVFDNGIRMIAFVLLSFSAFGTMIGVVNKITGYLGALGETLSVLAFFAGFVYWAYYLTVGMYAHGLFIIESGKIVVAIEKAGLFIPEGNTEFTFDDLEYYKLREGKSPFLTLRFRGAERRILTNKWQMYQLFEYLEQTVPDKRRHW